MTDGSNSLRFVLDCTLAHAGIRQEAMQSETCLCVFVTRATKDG